MKQRNNNITLTATSHSTCCSESSLCQFVVKMFFIDPGVRVVRGNCTIEMVIMLSLSYSQHKPSPAHTISEKQDRAEQSLSIRD